MISPPLGYGSDNPYEHVGQCAEPWSMFGKSLRSYTWNKSSVKVGSVFQVIAMPIDAIVNKAAIPSPRHAYAENVLCDGPD